MGFLSDIFGSSTDEIGPIAPLVRQASTLTGGQEDLLKQLTSFLGGEVGQGAPSFPGQLSAGASPIQQQTFGLTSQLTAPGGVFQGGQDALSNILAGFDPQSTTDFFERSIQAPALENFERNIIPQIQSSFANVNAGSSGALNRALAEAGRGVTTDLSTQLSELLFSTEQAQRGQQLQASGTALGLPLQAGGALGSEQRGIEQQGLDRLFSEFLRTQPGYNPSLNLLPTALGVNAFENIVTDATIQQEASPFSQLLGGAGGLLSGLGSVGKGGGFGSIF